MLPNGNNSNVAVYHEEDSLRVSYMKIYYFFHGIA